MESKAKLLGHPVHQMLVAFPLGLLATGVLFDIVYFATDNTTFAHVAYWVIIGGIVGGLVAAPFGFVDWLRAIPAGTRAKRIGAIHGGGNLIVVLLFIGSAILRAGMPEDPSAWAYVLSFVGAGLALVTAWLGGELVDRLGVGVYSDANADAPSSVGRHAAMPHRTVGSH
ncbi:MAG TPA: DUF2231 domain-containing protein [Gammaproteobacteria bacterium]|nr:DUF2231 domain-containing protein [Gammaproteobacteria bacterium]